MDARLAEKNEENRVYVLDIAHTHEYERLHLDRLGGHTRAFIKVQDGCNQFCSYCIIPYARGRVRSRSHEDVAEEVKGLVAGGYKEVVLTGIHLSSYGIERMEENPVSHGDWNHRGAAGADKGSSRHRGAGAHPSGIFGAKDHYQRICRGAGKASQVLPSFPSVSPERL